MRLRHIEVFSAVMLTGSVSAAARLMNVTQPAVSRTLQHAESQLGFPLFTRSKGRLIPTEEAKHLYPHIERLFSQISEVDRLVAGLRNSGDQQELRVATVLALTHEILPRALKAFQAKHSTVSVRIEALHSEQIVSSLLLHTADIGFAFNPPIHPNIVATPLANTRIRCIVPKSMVGKTMARKGSVALREVSRLPIVALDGQDPLGSVVNQVCLESGIGLRSAFTVQTYHAALALAHHGLAVALVDGCTALSANPDKVAVIDLESAIPVQLYSLRQQQHPDSVASRYLLGSMKKAMAALR